MNKVIRGGRANHCHGRYLVRANESFTYDEILRARAGSLDGSVMHLP